MIVPVCLAAAFASGVDVRRLVLLAAAVYLPLVLAGFVALLVWRSRQRDDHLPILFCEGVAAELRAGATMRDALIDAASSASVYDANLHRDDSVAVLARKLAHRFPAIGEELRHTIRRAATTGSEAAALFDGIGSLALAHAEVGREIKIAAAPGKATGALFVGAPVVYLVGQAMSGSLERMLRTSQQRTVALVGLGVFLLGASIASVVIWRATR